MTILITGLIGSGKSEAARHFEARGIPVYDCDSRCKALYREIPGLQERLEKLLGMKLCEFGGIFGCPEKKAALEDIVYPLLKDDFRKWRASKGETAALESATAGTDGRFADIYDRVLLVRASQERRFGRNPEAARRSPLQAEPESYDWLVRNNGTINELKDKLDTIINENGFK